MRILTQDYEGAKLWDSRETTWSERFWITGRFDIGREKGYSWLHKRVDLLYGIKKYWPECHRVSEARKYWAQGDI
jgi:hypothetical protein